MWKEACCTPKIPFCQLSFHLRPGAKSLYIPNIHSRQTQKLRTVVTYRVHNPIPSKAMNAVQLRSCQVPVSAGLIVRQECPGRHSWCLFSSTDGRFPSCPSVCWSPSVGAAAGCSWTMRSPSHPCPPPSLPSALSAGELCWLSPLDTGTGVTYTALNPFATDTQTPSACLRGRLRNQQHQQHKDIPQLSGLHREKKNKKIHNR